MKHAFFRDAKSGLTLPFLLCLPPARKASRNEKIRKTSKVEKLGVKERYGQLLLLRRLLSGIKKN